MSTPKVSIIIPVLNQWSYTEQCLRSIQTFTDLPNLEIIVVDNGSTDETKESLKKYPQVKTITFTENRGFTEACNTGARASSGEILCFLNNDTILSKNWLSPLIEELKSGAGIVGPKLVFPLSYDINSGGYVFYKDIKAFTPLFYNIDAGHPVVSKRRSLSALLGACILINKAVFDEVEGFTDIGLEDVDLCLKVKKTGREIIWTPLSTVFHYGSVTISSHLESDLPKRSGLDFRRMWPYEQFRDELTETLASEGFRASLYEKSFFRYESQHESGFEVSTKALTLCLEGDVKSAISLLEKEVSSNPFHKQSHEVLATLYSVQQDFSRAAAIWQKVMEERPFCFIAYLEAVKVEIAQNNEGRAVEIIERLNKFPIVPFELIDNLQGVLR